MIEGMGLVKASVLMNEHILEIEKAYFTKLLGANFADVEFAVNKAKDKKVQRMKYIRVEGKNEAILEYSNCQYKDACLAVVKEGIKRPIGGFQCEQLFLDNVRIDIITGKHFDYVLDEFNKPDCRGRLFEA